MVAKRGDAIAEGWYLAPTWVLRMWWETLSGEAAAIGDWAIVAFYGGMIKGAGYGEAAGQGKQAILIENADAAYHAFADPDITDVLLVSFSAADASYLIGGGFLLEAETIDASWFGYVVAGGSQSSSGSGGSVSGSGQAGG